MEKTQENVFYCDQHDEGIAVASGEDAVKCGICGKEAKVIGWFEYHAE